MFDIFVTGLKTFMLSCLVDADSKALAKVVRTIFFFYDQEGMEERVEKARGFNSMNQMERVHLITKVPLDLVLRNRLHWPGTNRGNTVGPVAPVHFEGRILGELHGL